MESKSNHRNQTLRRSTIDALRTIAAAKGWKIVEAAERAAQALAKQERIALPRKNAAA